MQSLVSLQEALADLCLRRNLENFVDGLSAFGGCGFDANIHEKKAVWP